MSRHQRADSPRLGRLVQKVEQTKSDGYPILGFLAKRWSPVEVSLACTAINRLQKEGPVATTQSLPFFTKDFALKALRVALSNLTDDGQKIVANMIKSIEDSK